MQPHNCYPLTVAGARVSTCDAHYWQPFQPDLMAEVERRRRELRQRAIRRARALNRAVTK